MLIREINMLFGGSTKETIFVKKVYSRLRLVGYLEPKITDNWLSMIKYFPIPSGTLNPNYLLK